MPSFSSGYKSEYIALYNELETKLKKIIYNAVMQNIPELTMNIALLKLIKEFKDRIPDDFDEKDKMIKAIMVSKTNLYNQYKQDAKIGYQKAKEEVEGALGVKITSPNQLIGILINNLAKLKASEIPDVSEETTIAFTKGFPYIENYYKHLRGAISKFVDDTLAEPKEKRGVKKGALSVRSMLEKAIRSNFHEEQRMKFLQSSVRLVYISTHADCSDRCEPFQGRLFSLDGTSGVIDGEKFEPIEKATDIFVKTKNGRVWKNGLFGFNCRHRMIEYSKDLQRQDDYTSEEIKQEREVSEQQRAYERQIFKLKEKAFIMQETQPRLATLLRKKAKMLYDKYVAYSEKNNHAFYPDRCAISNQLKKYVLDK